MSHAKTISIYCSRHGQTEANLQSLTSTWSDSPLTEEGKQRGASLAKQLWERFPQTTRLYCSERGRTRATAQFIVEEFRQHGIQLPLTSHAGFNEANAGDFEGSSMLEPAFRSARQAFWSYGPAYPPREGEPLGTGESRAECEARIHTAIDEILTGASDGDTIGVVSSGAILKAFLAKSLGWDLETVVRRGITNAAPFVVTFNVAEDGSWTIATCEVPEMAERRYGTL